MSGGAGVFGSGGGGIDQALSNFLDPGNIFGGSASSNPVSNFLDPFETIGMNPTVTANNTANSNAAGGGSTAIPNTLPNLGATSMVPQAPQGAFTAPAKGNGQFNDMAAQLAGPLFNPAAVNPNAASWIPNPSMGSPTVNTNAGGAANPGVGTGAGNPYGLPPALVAKLGGGNLGTNTMVTLPANNGGAPITIPLASILPQSAQQSAAKTMPYYSSLIQKV